MGVCSFIHARGSGAVDNEVTSEQEAFLQSIERARAKLGDDHPGRVRFAVADITTLEAPSGGFDLIAMLNMPPLFAPIARLLAPGGHVAWASSMGSDTPFYTPTRVLVRGFARHQIRPVDTGEAGSGTYYLGRQAARG